MTTPPRAGTAPRAARSALGRRHWRFRGLGEISKDIASGFDKKPLVNMSMAGAYQSPANFQQRIAKDGVLMREVIAKANAKTE